MMFILRDRARRHPPAGLTVKASRETPGYADAGGGTDYFFVASRDDADRLAAGGHRVIALRDGWYELDAGGIAVWGAGRYWELRDTPFTVVEASE